MGAPLCACDAFSNGTLTWNGANWSGTCLAGPFPRLFSTGSAFTCAIHSDRRLKCWGSSGSGALGLGPTNPLADPKTAPFNSVVSNVTRINSGSSITCALQTDTSLYCWGGNTVGGTGVSSSVATTVQLPTLVLKNVSHFAVGNEHTCAAHINGDLRCWGRNTYGQLGNGTANFDKGVPPSVVTTGVKSVACTLYGTCIVKFNGDVLCAGYIMTSTVSSTFTLQGNIGVSGSLSCGGYHCCYILADSSLRCWGRNSDGQLGSGASSATVTPFTSASLIFASGIARVAVGAFHTCAVNSNGQLYCWGSNTFGQLGINNTLTQVSPVLVPNVGNVSNVFSGIGSFFTCATLTTGGFKCWGQNNGGQLGIGSTVGEISASNAPVNYLTPQ